MTAMYLDLKRVFK